MSNKLTNRRWTLKTSLNLPNAYVFCGNNCMLAAKFLKPAYFNSSGCLKPNSMAARSADLGSADSIFFSNCFASGLGQIRM